MSKLLRRNIEVYVHWDGFSSSVLIGKRSRKLVAVKQVDLKYQ